MQFHNILFEFINSVNFESLNDEVYHETCTEFGSGRFAEGRGNQFIVFQPDAEVQNVMKITLG